MTIQFQVIKTSTTPQQANNVVEACSNISIEAELAASMESTHKSVKDHTSDLNRLPITLIISQNSLTRRATNEPIAI